MTWLQPITDCLMYLVYLQQIRGRHTPWWYSSSSTFSIQFLKEFMESRCFKTFWGCPVYCAASWRSWTMWSMRTQMFTGNVWMTMIETGRFRRRRIWERIMKWGACSILRSKVYKPIGWADAICRDCILTICSGILSIITSSSTNRLMLRIDRYLLTMEIMMIQTINSNQISLGSFWVLRTFTMKIF